MNGYTGHSRWHFDYAEETGQPKRICFAETPIINGDTTLTESYSTFKSATNENRCRMVSVTFRSVPPPIMVIHPKLQSLESNKKHTERHEAVSWTTTKCQERRLVVNEINMLICV